MGVVDKGFETHLRILEALKKLVKGQSMDSVTVGMICKEAGISRQTFYNHFVDKYEIPQIFFNRMATAYLFESGRSLSYHDANLENNKVFYKNREFMAAMFETRGYQSFLRYCRRARMANLIETITEYKKVEFTKDLERILDFHLIAETHTIVEWVCKHPDDSPEYVADILDRCIPKELYEIIKDPTPGCERPENVFDLY